MSFRGCYTALVTPFRKGEIDYAALEKLIEFQIRSGVAGLVPCGTTGEVPTLHLDEQHKLIEFVIDRVNGRVQVIAGTGFNSTEKSIEMSRFAQKAGANGVLLVNPYYNKPTQEGLYQHFAAIAHSLEIPVMLYNIPSRSAVGLSAQTIARLSEIENIQGVKEAGGDVAMVSAIRQLCKIPVLSGDDALTLPMMAVGAVGVVSVASNLVPAEMFRLVQAAKKEKLTEASKLHDQLFPLFRALFAETNPIGIKAALAMTGWIEEELRLPMTVLSSEPRKVLEKALQNAGLLQAVKNPSKIKAGKSRR